MSSLVATGHVSEEVVAEEGLARALRLLRDLMHDELYRVREEYEPARIVWRIRPDPRYFGILEVLAIVGADRVEYGLRVRTWRRETVALRRRPSPRERRPLTPGRR